MQVGLGPAILKCQASESEDLGKKAFKINESGQSNKFRTELAGQKSNK